MDCQADGCPYNAPAMGSRHLATGFHLKQIWPLPCTTGLLVPRALFMSSFQKADLEQSLTHQDTLIVQDCQILYAADVTGTVSIRRYISMASGNRESHRLPRSKLQSHHLKSMSMESLTSIALAVKSIVTMRRIDAGTMICCCLFPGINAKASDFHWCCRGPPADPRAQHV